MKFSVLMSVYRQDKPEHFDLAFQSIWFDQILKPSQVVLVKDGPLTKELDECVSKWEAKLNECLSVVELPQNVGLGKALNEGLKYCDHDLVARMDADDISVPERFNRQLSYMAANSDIVASSAFIREFSEINNVNVDGDIRALPLIPEDIKKYALSRSPLNHPVAIFRKSKIIEVGGYPALRKAQDYGLWTQLLAKGYRLGNIPDVLLLMRSGEGIGNRRGYQQLISEVKLLNFQRTIGFINRRRYTLNFSIRLLARIAPNSIRRMIYKSLRRRKV